MHDILIKLANEARILADKIDLEKDAELSPNIKLLNNGHLLSFLEFYCKDGKSNG